MHETQQAEIPHALTPDEVAALQHASFAKQHNKNYPVNRTFFGNGDSYTATAAHFGLNERSGVTLETILMSLKGKPAKILDVGCGIGTALGEIKKELPDATCIGIAAEPDLLPPPGVRIEFGDAQRLPTLLREHPRLPQQYDFITAVRIADHLIDPLALVEGVYEVLAPNGKAYISHFPILGMSREERRALEERLESRGIEVLQVTSRYFHLYIDKRYMLTQGAPERLDFNVDKYPPRPLSPFRQILLKDVPRIQYKIKPDTPLAEV